jgi:ADP-ribose pyrophosphatase YjhB (NUDIX family)
MSERHQMRVSCKCALYTQDGSKVLLAHYGSKGYGLPGGHMEANESPDQAVRRELQEEIGVAGDALERKDFWMHKNGKLVLGYTGRLDEVTNLTLQEEEVSAVVWANIDDVASGTISVPSYSEFICKFRPKS